MAKQLSVLQNGHARLLASLPLEQGESIRAIAMTDQRLFLSLFVRSLTGGGSGGDFARLIAPGAGLRVLSIDRQALAAGRFEVGRATPSRGEFARASRLAASGQRAIVTVGESKLALIDAADPTRPSVVRELEALAAPVTDLVVAPGSFLAVMGGAGIASVPISD